MAEYPLYEYILPQPMSTYALLKNNIPVMAEYPPYEYILPEDQSNYSRHNDGHTSRRSFLNNSISSVANL